MAYDKLVDSTVLENGLTNIANAIRAKGETTAKLSFPNGYINAINNISSGVELNFEVVGGTTAPSNPEENTIWVNTAASITSWDFSAEEPHRRSRNKNLNVYPYYETTQTHNGITFTDNGDGTITASGTTSDSIAYFVCSAQRIEKNELILTPGTYTLSGGLTNVVVSIRCTADDWATNIISRDSQSLTATFTIDQTVKARIFIAVPKNTTLTNAVIKPQLEKGTAATEFVKGDAGGQVWIATGNASTGEFNALKKNGVMVYPLEAKQYVNGAWVSKASKTYRGGTWVDWLNKLYSYGNTYDVITGGWKGVKDEGGAFTFNTDNIYVGYSGGTKRDAAVYTVNKIDTTGYSKLKVYVNITATQANYGYGFSIGLSSSNTSYSASGFVAVTEQTATGYATMSLDLSNYQGSYYIKLQAEVSKANVYEVWLEK